MAEQIDAGAHPLEGIIRKIHFPESAEKAESNLEASQPDHRQISTPPVQPQLSLSALSTPAILINDALEILWHNPAAIEKIWQDTTFFGNGSKLPSVFRLLFNANFQGIVENWRQWAGFFLNNGLAMTSREKVKSLVTAQSQRRRTELESLMGEDIRSRDPAPPLQRLRLTRKNGTTDRYLIAALDFEQGRLLVFYPAGSEPSAKQHAIEDAFIDESADAEEKRVYFLSATLSHADTLQMEMLPKDYCRLLKTVWNKSTATIEQFGGIIKYANSDAILGVFLGRGNDGYHPLEVIQCALELKSRMNAIGRQWKMHNGWRHQVALNIGLHHNHEFVGRLTSTSGVSVSTFGNGHKAAECLSAMADNGEIFASKNLIHQLSSEDLAKIRFGVARTENQHHVFIERGFMQLKDMFGISGSGHINGHSTLVATQIFSS